MFLKNDTFDKEEALYNISFSEMKLSVDKIEALSEIK
jgi:hypothetical protein